MAFRRPARNLLGRGVSTERVPTYAFTPQDEPLCKLWMCSAFTSAMWQESVAAGHGTTHPAVDTDPVGRIDTPCGPHHIQAATNATRPLLSSGGTRNSSLRFTRASSARVDVYNSKSDFRYLHDGGFMIVINVRFASNGTRQYLFDTSNDTIGAGNYGIRCFKNTDHTFWVDIYGGHATNYLKQWNVPTLTINDTNDHQIIITLDAIPGTLSFRLDGGTAQTTSVVATNQVATGQNSVNDLRIGGDLAGGGHWLDAYVSDFMIFQGVPTANQAALLAYNPARSSDSLLRYTATTITDPMTQLSHLYLRWRHSDASTLLQSSGGAAVALDGDPVGVVNSATGHLSRGQAQATSNRRPVLRLAAINGKPAVEWVGASGTGGVNQDLTYTAWPKGAISLYALVKNTVTGTAGGTGHEGSHIFSGGYSGTVYAGISGPSTSLGGTPNRTFLHGTNTSNVSMPSNIGMPTTGYHLLVYIRDGASHNLWFDGVEVDPAVVASLIGGALSKTTLTAAETFAPTHMGEQAFPITNVEGSVGGWWDFNGQSADVFVFNAAHDATYRNLMGQFIENEYAHSVA